mmetsp:Transcript_43109/g.99290  ORF Transcript_43109/g.99290 Transcript_43109/m.99290 type:complete len:239 (+) Transcript_43109:1024-1740(+)
MSRASTSPLAFVRSSKLFSKAFCLFCESRFRFSISSAAAASSAFNCSFAIVSSRLTSSARASAASFNFSASSTSLRRRMKADSTSTPSPHSDSLWPREWPPGLGSWAFRFKISASASASCCLNSKRATAAASQLVQLWGCFLRSAVSGLAEGGARGMDWWTAGNGFVLSTCSGLGKDSRGHSSYRLSSGGVRWSKWILCPAMLDKSCSSTTSQVLSFNGSTQRARSTGLIHHKTWLRI